MEVGLYFGSFNPVHVGHLIIASHVAQHTPLQQVWLVVSPHNPLKPSAGLLNEYHRLHLVKLAIGDNPRLRASDIEFKLPRPSYTIDTLTYLSEKYPAYTFTVIIGSDSYQNLHKWKNHEQLAAQYKLLVYQRPGFSMPEEVPAGVTVLQAPMLDISATFIRRMVAQGKSIQYLVPDAAAKEIEENNYYR